MVYFRQCDISRLASSFLFCQVPRCFFSLNQGVLQDSEYLKARDILSTTECSKHHPLQFNFTKSKNVFVVVVVAFKRKKENILLYALACEVKTTPSY